MGTIASILKQLIYTLAVVVYRLASLFSRNTNLHTARFARLHELTDLFSTSLEPDTSLLLGVRRLDHVLRVQPSSARRELGNLLIAAPTRGGKGLLAVSQLLTWRHSVVVNDIKGDLFSQTAGFRSQLGPVFVFDPTGIGHCYDPLTNRTTEDELLSSATHLLFKADEGDGAIFTQRAAVMLTQLLLAAREEGTAPLPYVREIIRSGLPAAAEKLQAISPDLATQFLDVSFMDANLSDRFLLSAWGTLSARMRPLLTETVVRSLAGEDFQAGEVISGRQPVTALS